MKIKGKKNSNTHTKSSVNHFVKYFTLLPLTHDTHYFNESTKTTPPRYYP